MSTNPYEILGLAETANLDQIKAAYKNLLAQDKANDRAWLDKINWAYGVISDPNFQAMHQLTGAKQDTELSSLRAAKASAINGLVNQIIQQQESSPHPSNNRQATKACPFCGEEILAVAKKCKHCGSMVVGTLNDPQKVAGSEETDSHRHVQPSSHSGIKRKQLLFIGVLGSLFLIVYLFLSHNRTSEKSDITKNTATSYTNTKPLSFYELEQITDGEQLVKQGKLEEAKAIANIYKDRKLDLVSDLVSKLNKKIEEAEYPILINQAEQLLKDGKIDDGMKILTPMVQANKPDALRVVNEHKQRIEDDKLPPLPPQAFPIAEQASVSTATKFSSYLGKKYLVFDLSGASVDDLKKETEGPNYYINGVRDFVTNEYVSLYNIKFYMNSNLAQEFYKILPESGKGMIHYRCFCLPRFTSQGLVTGCQVIKYQQFNVGGTMINSAELNIENIFNASKRSRQKEILKNYFGIENMN